MNRRDLTATLIAVIGGLSLASAGCAASAAFDGSVYRDKEVAFGVPSVPASWSRVSLPDADLAFRDDAHDASILINSRCHASDNDAPLVSLTDHLIIGTTDRKISREETLSFDGREARHTVLTARLDGVPMAYDIFVMKKDGCVYDLVRVSSPAAATGGSAEWETFARSFHVMPRPG